MQIVRGEGTIACMKIHHSLLGLGVAVFVSVFVGCSQYEEPDLGAMVFSDEETIDRSVAEAFGEGDMFNHHHANMPEDTKKDVIPRFEAQRRKELDSRPARLKELTIWNRGLGDVSGLAKWKALKSLYLTDNEIRDVRPLAQLANLEELYLDRNPVADVSALAGCKKLKVLSLRGTRAAEGPSVAKLRAALPNCEIILE